MRNFLVITRNFLILTSPLSCSVNLSKYIFVSLSLGIAPRKPYECDSDAAADIMLLVDGSWSIGRTNFRRVRDFLEGLVTPFNIGPNHIQIGEDKAISRNQLVI